MEREIVSDYCRDDDVISWQLSGHAVLNRDFEMVERLKRENETIGHFLNAVHDVAWPESIGVDSQNQRLCCQRSHSDVGSVRRRQHQEMDWY